MTPDIQGRAMAMLADPLFAEAKDHLLARAGKRVLNATTPEDREEEHKTYRALKDVIEQVEKWAKQPVNPNK